MSLDARRPHAPSGDFVWMVALPIVVVFLGASALVALVRTESGTGRLDSAWCQARCAPAASTTADAACFCAVAALPVEQP